jgi:hypothetical protein
MKVSRRDFFFFYIFVSFFSCPLDAWFITAEVLDWKAQENGLSLAIKSRGSPDRIDEATVKDIDFQYSVGARFGIGAALREHWELFLQGTHYHNYTSTTEHADDSFLFPIWINPEAGSNGFVERAKARWRLHFGMIDLTLARKIFLGTLLLKPFFGLRGVIARQKYEIDYFGGSLFPQGEDVVHMKNKFFGLGPIGGITATWRFWKPLAFYASLDLALPYGRFYIHESEFATVGIKRRLRIFHEFYLVRAIADCALGIRASYRWLSVNLGWEEHLLFGQNQLIRFVGDNAAASQVSNQGDLTFSGLVGGVAVVF